MGLESSWSELLVSAAIVMVISYTLTRERVFSPLRERLGGRDTFFGYLASCPFCASWWLAFIVVPITKAYLYSLPPDANVLERFGNWFLSAAFLVAVAAFLRVAFFFVDEAQGLVRRQQQTADVEREVLERQLPLRDQREHRVQ